MNQKNEIHSLAPLLRSPSLCPLKSSLGLAGPLAHAAGATSPHLLWEKKPGGWERKEKWSISLMPDTREVEKTLGTEKLL